MSECFEGVEKKLEMVVADQGPNLRDIPKATWAEVVSKSRASILSEIKTQDCTAYLLSESSLFVFDDRMVMITCGQTRLIDAADYVLENVIPRSKVESIFYERKNEAFPGQQPSCFEEDVKRLEQEFDGEALRLGSEFGNHVLVYASAKEKELKACDTTTELLMHGICKNAMSAFNSTEDSNSVVEALRNAFPGFEVDEYFFDPKGYSINALKEDLYFTFHVTPEDPASYVSFETNFPFLELPETYWNGVCQVLETLKPKSFDFLQFVPKQIDNTESAENAFTQFPYESNRQMRTDLPGPYRIYFSQFCEIDKDFTHTGDVDTGEFYARV